MGGGTQANPEITDAVFARELYRHGQGSGLQRRLRLALSSARAQAVNDDAALMKAGRISNLLSQAERFERLPLSAAAAI